MQSRRLSLFESVTNACIGLMVSWAFTYFCLPLFGINPGAAQALVITLCYFVLSLGRGYVLRRAFARLEGVR